MNTYKRFVKPGECNMAISDESIELALEHGRHLDAIQPRAISARFVKDRLILEFDNGAEVAVPLALLPPAIRQAHAQGFVSVKIEGAGHDLYMPEIDEGLYIPDLCARATFGELAVAA